MGIFDKFKSKSVPKSYLAVNVEFTEEEIEAIDLCRERFADIANADAPPRMKLFVQPKVKDAMIARGLTEYAEELLTMKLRECSSSEEAALLMDKAINAQMKAYTIHNLPAYLARVADLFELSGDAAEARKFFSNFLREEAKFKPDEIDTMFLDQPGFDIPKAIALAKITALAKKEAQ